MRIPFTYLGSSRPSLIILAMAGPLVTLAAQVPSPPDKVKEGPSQPAEIKGEAKISVHSIKMRKGTTYRVTVRGDGFTPQIWIQGDNATAVPAGALAVNPAGAALLNPILPRGPSNVARRIFTAAETKAYDIKVDYSPSSEAQKGPLVYTFTVERAVFQPQVNLKESRLEISEHGNKLEQGKTYGITVTGTGFAPEVQIMDGSRSVATAFSGRWFGFGPDAEFVTTMTFAPGKTLDYRILVSVGPVAGQRLAPLTYTTRIVELKVELSVQAQLTKQDPVYPRRGGLYKLYTVKLEAGKVYQIDMMSRALDAYLFLEDAAGNLLTEDDDGGENRNARIIFRPSKTATYRVVATTFERAAGAAGPYTLTVMENPHAQPRFGTLSSVDSDAAAPQK
jgi:hypothetical protein